MREIYLNTAATTPVRPKVLAAMMPSFIMNFGNPSSIDSFGKKAKEVVEQSRQSIAKVFDCAKNDVIFTSGGSESNNLAIKGVVNYNNVENSHIITTRIEHHSVLNAVKDLEMQGCEVTYLGVDPFGFIDLTELAESIKDNTVLVSVGFVNNELGCIQPIEEIAAVAHSRRVLFHTDAVQGYPHLGTERLQCADLISISGHKFGAPKGIGCLIKRGGVDLQPLITGGSQEHYMRAGTENVHGIVGLTKAIELLEEKRDTIRLHEKLLTNRLYVQLMEIPESQINSLLVEGSGCPGIINISFSGIEAESLLIAMEQIGISASAGSACTAGTDDPSHVLEAINLDSEFLHGTIRLSFDSTSTIEEIDYAASAIKELVRSLRRFQKEGR